MELFIIFVNIKSKCVVNKNAPIIAKKLSKKLAIIVNPSKMEYIVAIGNL